MNRKKLVLFILLGVLALVAGRELLRDSAPPPPAPGVSPAATPSGRSSVRGGEGMSSGEEGVRLDLLNREREAFQEPRRDLFASLYREKPSAPPSMPSLPPPPPLPPVPNLPPPAFIPPPPPVPGGAAQQELARFTYLGFLEKKGVKTIFLSAGDEIFVVKQGDRFGRGGQFEVAQISPDRLVVRQQNDPRPITIPLVEQAPLAPSRVGGGRSGVPRSGFPGSAMPGGMPGAVTGAPPPQDDFVPEEPAPDEEPPQEEPASPFISPGQLGSQGVLQPFQRTPAPAPGEPPRPGPAFNQPAR